MKFHWKQALGSVALSAMALGIIGTDGAAARHKSDKIKQNMDGVTTTPSSGQSQSSLPPKRVSHALLIKLLP